MNRVLSSAALAVSLVVSAFAQYPGADRPPADLEKGYDAIKIDDAKKILGFLATQCEGRGTGQPGFEKASEFMARQFQALGLKPLGDDGTFLQKTTFTRARIDPASVSLSVKDKDLKLGSRDVALFGGGDAVSVSGPIYYMKFDGRGEWNDNFKPNGGIVILETGQPNNRLAFNAIAAGAAAVLTVVKKTPMPSWQARMGDEPPNNSRITGAISEGAVSRLLKEGGAQMTRSAPDQPFIWESGPMQILLDGKRVVEKVQVGNVVGELEGTDPTLKSEYIGVGGHLDHLGIRNGVVYPGADDDGSGATAVLEVAKAMVANPLKPRRSIVFMTFFGEEMGLLGSRYLVNHPPVPLDHMVSELQMDMVGRDSDGIQNGDRNRVDVASENVDTIRLVGSKRISTELDQDIQNVNKYVGFRFKYDAEDVYTRSDHYSFAAKGIPIAFLFDGFHPDYHQPTDTVDKIDWVKLTNAAKLYFLTALTVANADLPPKKDVQQK
ncbi:MAG TPA: M20/M25/M40 family metallo-hydrolase [Fimbriimonas sp.]|nr:M20/M25/M40 family metallo-hydrolase [Fimbriimonas sp.]